jgi:23S rRNA pseudouridine955/2504/2580 synthase
VVESFADAALLEVEPLTGRMHQIRVHLAAIGHPIVGDGKYGTRRAAPRLFLHASSIELPNPAGGAPLRIDSPLPGEFSRFLDKLRERRFTDA